MPFFQRERRLRSGRPPGAGRCLLLGLIALAGCVGARASAQETTAPEAPPPLSEIEAGERTAPHGGRIAGLPYQAGIQVTAVGQNLFPFRSPYAGPNSLPAKGQFAENETYMLLLGLRLRPNLDLYANPEVARGVALSRGLGLGGYLNGHFIPPGAYIARAFARWTIRAGRGATPIAAGDNQLPMTAPARRLVVTAGKFSTNDFFDLNRYAVNPRTQFMNFALDNSTAWDYAQDVRGYTRGVIVEWIHPTWTLRAGSAQVPTTAGGPELAADLLRNRGDQLEGEFQPRLLGRGTEPAVVRLLAFRNLADMGNYRRANRLSRVTGQPPAVTASRREGAATYGFNFNFEQPLADNGETGLFGRLGWNDGQNESWGYTECDHNASWGIQLSGARWRRADDRLGIGFGVNGLSAPHQRYLALGGTGFTLGDGALNYGLEQILEVYYACQLLKPLTLTLDYQHIRNPGYNQDRGPASAVAVRAHVNY